MRPGLGPSARLGLGAGLMLAILVGSLVLIGTSERPRPSGAGAGDPHVLARADEVVRAQSEVEVLIQPGDHAVPADGVVVEAGQAPSLQGAALDGRLRQDETGRLVEDRELRRLFDHLLAGQGEVGLAALRERLRAHALEVGGEALARQALDAFERYLDYLRSEAELDPAGIADLGRRLDALAALRRRLLGEDLAEAFFGEEERYARDALARMAGDEGLVDAPEAERWRAERSAATEHQRALEQTEQFEHLDLPPAQRHAERAALYGEAAADRLAALDAERAAWQQRLDDWRSARERIGSNPRLDTAARERALQAELDARFDPAEQRRVRALDELPPGGG